MDSPILSVSVQLGGRRQRLYRHSVRYMGSAFAARYFTPRVTLTPEAFDARMAQPHTFWLAACLYSESFHVLAVFGPTIFPGYVPVWGPFLTVEDAWRFCADIQNADACREETTRGQYCLPPAL